MEREAKERASFDYILANLIGRSVARALTGSNRMPDISEVYPTLFNAEEIEEQKVEKTQEVSAIRFKQFANSFNKNFKKEGNKN